MGSEYLELRTTFRDIFGDCANEISGRCVAPCKGFAGVIRGCVPKMEGYTATMPKGQEKDVQKTPPSFVPDVQKEGRDISNVLSILDAHQIKTAPFGANVSGENSYKRAERISAALHLITSHIPEEEPLRNLTRSKGLGLLSLILELRSGLRAPASEKGQAVLALIRELISCVRLLAISGFISAQNSGALIEALDELGSLIVISQRSTLAEQFSISRAELTPPSGQENFRPISREQRTIYKRDIKDTQNTLTSDDRSQQVLDILKFGGVLGIKDITANLPQYSEKMIQRELLELVSLGKIQKIGEKRWSKYSAVR